MGLNETVSAERVHIAFFGLRNAGKSSLVNAVTGQNLAVVSDVLGTTTDPVKKAMELLPIGPVVIIDTPGFDDEGKLGLLRVEKTRQVLSKSDVAVIVHDATKPFSETEMEFIALIEQKKIPCLIAFNKADLLVERKGLSQNEIYVSASSGENIHELKEKIAAFAKKEGVEKRVVGDILKAGDTVVMVMPIDAAAPKGRIILPQQQTLRDILDSNCRAVCCKDTELESTLNALRVPPALVITDSQVFGKVSKVLPESVPLTSFSILFARYKGDLATLTRGAKALSTLKDGDRVLISEGCTHHRQCGDIGSVKIPAWIRAFSKSEPQFEFTSGSEFPADLSKYRLIVHCGGCMLNEREMQSRISGASSQTVPIVNYGVAIAHMNGILRRSLAPFPEILKILDE